MKRYAIVRGRPGEAGRRELEAYLPENYKLIWSGDVPRYPGSEPSPDEVQGHVIEGEDSAGWTLDAYVKPRLMSGMIACEEIDLSHPIMKEIPINA